LQANAGRAEHEEPPETPQESELANALLELWAWADLSPQKMQAITAACVRDCRAMGLEPHPRVQRLSTLGTGGVHSQNCHRDLVDFVLRPVRIAAAKVEINVLYRAPPLQVREALHTILLPHKLFSILYEDFRPEFLRAFLGGDEGNAARFWDAAAGDPQFPEHPMLQQPAVRARTVPISLHGDGLPVSGCGKAWQKSAEAYSWTSLLSGAGAIAGPLRLRHTASSQAAGRRSDNVMVWWSMGAGRLGGGEAGNPGECQVFVQCRSHASSCGLHEAKRPPADGRGRETMPLPTPPLSLSRPATESSTLSCNFLLTLVYKALCVRQPPDRATMKRIWQEICWSLRALYEGVWPVADSAGVAFQPGTPDAARAGTPLAGGWRCVLWSLRGDLDHMSSAYGLANYNSNFPCWACQANRRDIPWTDFRRPAVWEQTCWAAAAWVQAMPDRHPIFNLPGVGILAVSPDLMHDWYSGVLQYFFGSVLFLLVKDVLPGNAEQNLQTAWASIQARYHGLGVTSQLRELRASMFFPKAADKFPQLKARAAEVQGLIRPLLGLWEESHRREDQQHRRILIALRMVDRVEVILNDYRRDFCWPADVAQRFCDHVFDFLQIQAALGDFYQTGGAGRPGRYLFLATIKSHYMAHIALRSFHSNPCMAWCFAGEDLMGRVKHFVAAAQHGRRPEQVIRVVLEKYCCTPSWVTIPGGPNCRWRQEYEKAGRRRREHTGKPGRREGAGRGGAGRGGCALPLPGGGVPSRV
jgi:hypothetical protein